MRSAAAAGHSALCARRRGASVPMGGSTRSHTSAPTARHASPTNLNSSPKSQAARASLPRSAFRAALRLGTARSASAESGAPPTLPRRKTSVATASTPHRSGRCEAGALLCRTRRSLALRATFADASLTPPWRSGRTSATATTARGDACCVSAPSPRRPPSATAQTAHARSASRAQRGTGRRTHRRRGGGRPTPNDLRAQARRRRMREAACSAMAASASSTSRMRCESTSDIATAARGAATGATASCGRHRRVARGPLDRAPSARTALFASVLGNRSSRSAILPAISAASAAGASRRPSSSGRTGASARWWPIRPAERARRHALNPGAEACMQALQLSQLLSFKSSVACRTATSSRRTALCTKQEHPA
mmetsp:Transcript_8003/g.15794  ORF Transcript_8003/g.15794 Transcript_8003/m.15794 type:complete len:368 (+) Transcript_8003:768-1871(+)